MIKYILTALACILLSAIGNTTFAQVYTTQHDSVYATVGTAANVDNKITVTATTPRKIKWAPTATNFPTDWKDGAVLGICDNNTCYSNFSNYLFTHNFISDEYMPGVAGDFHMALTMSSVTTLGTYYLTVNLIDDSLTLQSKNIVFVITHNTTGISSVALANQQELFLSPNPAADHTQLYFNITKDQNIEISISDALGKEVAHGNYEVSAHNPTVNIATSSFAAGIYYIKARTENGIITERLAINK